MTYVSVFFISQIANWHNFSKCYKNYRIQTKFPHLNGYWTASNWGRVKGNTCFNFNEQLLWSKYSKKSLPLKQLWVNQAQNAYLSTRYYNTLVCAFIALALNLNFFFCVCTEIYVSNVIPIQWDLDNVLKLTCHIKNRKEWTSESAVITALHWQEMHQKSHHIKLKCVM